MGKALGKLLEKFRGEQILLKDGIKCITDKLEHAESTYTTLAMNANNFAAENAHMKAELAKSHENHHQARASVQDPTVQVLMAERTRLERELAEGDRVVREDGSLIYTRNYLSAGFHSMMSID